MSPAPVPVDPASFARQREALFPRTWHVLDAGEPPEPGAARPATLLPGLLDEPLLLARPDAGPPRVLSNACTHRAALVCETAGAPAGGALRCRYHGRRFALDGQCLGAPGFEDVPGFPSPADHLPAAPHGRWGPLLFASLAPDHPLEELLAPLQALVGWLPLDRARVDASRSGDFLVPAHWALYLENYLEGFHVPFVHPSLATVLDWQDYETRLWPRGSVQVGFAKDDAAADAVLAAPAGHPDHARRVAGYYAWLWPCTMVNVYPWGLSLNLVQPLAPDRTRVRFLAAVWDAARLERGAGAGLHRVECEDEEVVGSVQRGMRARLWHGGRLSPRHEKGVEHFRRLLEREANRA